ncbi:MAG: (d)CMP kinase [Bdellovibrionales bacterium]|nr:(d)CMP kinase [Bdellovibrionales bacterium]
MKRVITIDGPAGSGKSTVAGKLAKRLAFVHLNSGALYRVIACQADLQGVSLEDEEAVAKLAQQIEFTFVVADNGETRLLVDGRDIASEIATNEAGKKASLVAVLPKVRKILTEVQRRAAQHSSVVVEGRDAGTVVFPDADCKFYLDANVEVRAERRHRELAQAGEAEAEMSREQVLSELQARDHRDETRSISPQKPADDAIIVDTSKLNVEEVVDELIARID